MDDPVHAKSGWALRIEGQSNQSNRAIATDGSALESPRVHAERSRNRKGGGGMSVVRSRVFLRCVLLRSAYVLSLLIGFAGMARAVDIQLPPETGVFKQDAGAELANGQCLICHSVEYVTTQPMMARPFWKASVQKMQQKYGAPIPPEQIEPLVDYLTKNYGLTTNAPTTAAGVPSAQATAGPRP